MIGLKLDQSEPRLMLLKAGPLESSAGQLVLQARKICLKGRNHYPMLHTEFCESSLSPMLSQIPPVRQAPTPMLRSSTECSAITSKSTQFAYTVRNSLPPLLCPEPSPASAGRP